MPEKMEKMLNLQETAELLGISTIRLKFLVREGRIPAYNIGGRYLRFKKGQIEEYRKNIPREETKENIYSSLGETLRDFFYFNDFYIISIIVVVILLYWIFKT